MFPILLFPTSSQNTPSSSSWLYIVFPASFLIQQIPHKPKTVFFPYSPALPTRCATPLFPSFLHPFFLSPHFPYIVLADKSSSIGSSMAELPVDPPIIPLHGHIHGGVAVAHLMSLMQLVLYFLIL